MTKDLYYTIPQRFEESMVGHSNVSTLRNESTEEFFLYRVDRIKQRDSILVWLSDAYKFTDTDYLSRPDELKQGDYVVIAKPEGHGGASSHLINEARIGVGKLGEFMGALHSRQMWLYEPPSFEEARERKKKWEAQQGRRAR